ncbi:MAG: zinc ribbon domain-containing protein [Oscillospiraceae bacterium]|nr:zinc ribbon domain-containing protein [Oscillospiraceae bacterium]
MKYEKFCQSCGMPMSEETVLGTENDGGKSQTYCIYCYRNGAFTADVTMDQMIDFCVPHMVQANPQLTAQQAKENMGRFFPTLKRWKA